MNGDYCECPQDVADTNAPMGGCTNCGRITRERASKISYSHWKSEEADTHRELKMLHAVQANKSFLLDFIDFYQPSFALLSDGDTLMKLRGIVENVETNVEKHHDRLTSAVRKQHILELEGVGIDKQV
jgi:hypothetical protein